MIVLVLAMILGIISLIFACLYFAFAANGIKVEKKKKNEVEKCI